jgi:hypothetical protein
MMPNNQLNVFLNIFLIMTLSGCSHMSKFDCPMKPGILCESMDQINARVDRVELRNENAPCFALSLDKNLLTHKKIPIWIASFVDKEGNYHEGHYIYSKNEMDSLKD